MNRPSLRSRPLRVNGIPILRDSLPFAAESPIARLQLNDRPGSILIERFPLLRYSVVFRSGLVSEAPYLDRAIHRAM